MTKEISNEDRLEKGHCVPCLADFERDCDCPMREKYYLEKFTQNLTEKILA